MMTNSKWRIHRVGLVDFWYYDEEEFRFLDGRLLLRGANGSGKSVTMQSFIPLLLDGNMRPERLDPFGSRARKMENYLLEDGDGREERTGYLYMEFKRAESEAYLTLGIGMRARRNKKMDTWYFCITDGRRVGKDILLYKDPVSKVTCSARELKNRIGEGGSVMDTQGEYALCVNRLLFGFETQEEYRELLELLIQLRTPKLSKEFRPSLINEILSGSLQTLSEDDLRPMSEAIENMDTLKTNLDTLQESIHAAEQIAGVYGQYNRIVLCGKADLFMGSVREYRDLEKNLADTEQEIDETVLMLQQEQEHYDALTAEEKVLSQERSSLSDSDAARLKEQEQKLLADLEERKTALRDKQRQLQDKDDRRKQVSERKDRQSSANDEKWDAVEKNLDEMGEAVSEIPFDDYRFMRSQLREKRDEACDFATHAGLLKDYTRKVEEAKTVLQEEQVCEDAYSHQIKVLDQQRNAQEQTERDLRAAENRLHETKQALIEEIYHWDQNNGELHLSKETMQEISRGIERFRSGNDYWQIRDLAKPAYETLQQQIASERAGMLLERDRRQQDLDETGAQLEQWKNTTDPEPERSEAVQENRRLLKEKGIPYRNFYRMVDFDSALTQEEAALLEEALLSMGILDALVISEEYREAVLSLDGDGCDRYIFTDAPPVSGNLMELLNIENPESDYLLYYEMSRVLSAVGIRGERQEEPPRDDRNTAEEAGCVQNGSWVDDHGNYGMGALEGTVTGTYEARYIGVRSRERWRMQKIQELEILYEQQARILQQAQDALSLLKKRGKTLEAERQAFPGGQALLQAAQDCEKTEHLLAEWKDKIRIQNELVDAERKRLDAVRVRVRELCRRCDLPARLDVFKEASAALHDYRELLTRVQVDHAAYLNGVSIVRQLTEQIEELDADLDDIRYDLGRSQNMCRETEGMLSSVREQLELTDYEQIRTRLDYCSARLGALPGEKEASVKHSSDLGNRERMLREKQEETTVRLEETGVRRDLMQSAFSAEYDLGYVMNPDDAPADRTVQAQQVLSQYAGKSGHKRQIDVQGSLQEVYHQNRGALAEYQITLRSMFEEFDTEETFSQITMKRIDIAAKYRGVPVKFPELIDRLKEDAQTLTRLLSERDRELFEDILANTISKKIREKIQASRRWVDKMNRLMESMKTSSGLTLSLKWKSRRADTEEQLDTRELVDLLQKDAEIMRPEETEQLSRHFRSKIDEARKVSGETGNVQSFHAIMREVLDYRKWFAFQLECRKTGEQKKELTDRVFYTFSGGEKAMSMYVPLFSAVAAKYAGAREDAPHLISLDEAFAGVDEMNIRDMFRLMVEFDFNFMINSQILWGDCDTVPALAICQLIRPENVRYVTVIRYVWNGRSRQMVTEDDEESYEQAGA